MANATPPDAGVPPVAGPHAGAPVAPQRLRRQHQRRTSGPSTTIPLVFDMETKPNSPRPEPRLNLFKATTGFKATGVGPLRWAEMSDRAHSHSGDVSDTLDRLLVEHDAEATLKCMQKDMHEERLKQLRQLQTTIGDDDWRYTPVERLIGLQ